LLVLNKYEPRSSIKAEHIQASIKHPVYTVIERDDRATPAQRSGLIKFRQRADTLRRSGPADQSYARTAYDVFASAADLMADLQRTRYTAVSNEVAQVRAAVQALRPDQPLEQQADQVRTFFDRAATALQAMARTQG
jgi:hypothetical protein